MVKGKMIRVRRLGSEGHLTEMLGISEAFDVLAKAIDENKIVYVEPYNHIIQDVRKLRMEISRIESALIIPPVGGG